jgi:hypothetical protein
VESPFRCGTAATDAKQRAGFPTGTPDARAAPQIIAGNRFSQRRRWTLSWGWAWPRSTPWWFKRRYIDHAGHAVLAMRVAEVGIAARLPKSVLIDRARVGKSSRDAIRIVRRTKISAWNARRAAGNTVAVTYPGPAHRVARNYVK